MATVRWPSLRSWAALILTASLAAIVLWRIALTSRPQPAPSQKSTAADDKNTNAIMFHLLTDNEWHVRAGMCDMIAETEDDRWIPALIPRAMDVDLRVRASAFSALARLAQLSLDVPDTRTSLADSEQNLLTWINRYDQHNNSNLADSLCEVFTNTDFTVLGEATLDRCLSCHAGSHRSTDEQSAKCQGCHSEIYQEWRRSAHAQSLSHIHLKTIDPATGKPELWKSGNVRGIGCIECHHLVEPQDDLTTQPLSTGDACPYRFAPSSTVNDRCAQCHIDVAKQWHDWMSSPRATRLRWPPGEISMSDSESAPDCADCHMADLPVDTTKRRHLHSWSARRDPSLLRRGLDIQVASRPDESGDNKVVLIVTNLAGHAFPTGTCRRAIRIAAGPSLDDLSPLTTISAACPGGMAMQTQPPLAPSERREFLVTLPAGTETIAYRLTYVRNHRADSSYELDFATQQQLIRHTIRSGNRW